MSKDPEGWIEGDSSAGTTARAPRSKSRADRELGWSFDALRFREERTGGVSANYNGSAKDLMEGLLRTFCEKEPRHRLKTASDGA
jgi:hypothetical protein